MSNAPLRDWLSSVDDLPDEVIRRLPDFDSWDIAPLTRGDSRVLVIEHRKAQEAQISPTYESTFTAGLKATLEASRKGERIVIEST